MTRTHFAASTFARHAQILGCALLVFAAIYPLPLAVMALCIHLGWYADPTPTAALVDHITAWDKPGEDCLTICEPVDA